MQIRARVELERWAEGAGHWLVQLQVEHRQEGAAVRGRGQYEAVFSFFFALANHPSTVVVVGLLSLPLDRRQLKMCQTATTVGRETINGGRLLA